MKLRLVLTVEVIMYRIEEYFDEETQTWEVTDADPTSENDVARGVVATREVPRPEEPYNDWEQTDEEIVREHHLQQLANELEEAGSRLASNRGLLPTIGS